MEHSEPLPLLLRDITGTAIGAFYDVYNELAGFPEFVVRRGMAIALADAGLTVRQEVPLPVFFRGRPIVTFKADLVIEPGVLIECKVRPEIDAFDKAQLAHYLKASHLEVGLLFNFGRRPDFSRVIYENVRKRPRIEPPADLDAILADVTEVRRREADIQDPRDPPRRQRDP
jgi:GxxExxY protein